MVDEKERLDKGSNVNVTKKVEVKSMNKNTKIVGVAVTVLLILLAATPAVHSIKSVKPENEQTKIEMETEKNGVNPNQILQILQNHIDDLSDLGVYLIDWGTSHGGLCSGGVNIDFVLSSDLQAKFDGVQSELQDYISSCIDINKIYRQIDGNQEVYTWGRSGPSLEGISKEYFEKDGKKGYHYSTWLGIFSMTALKLLLNAFELEPLLLAGTWLILELIAGEDVNEADTAIIATQIYCYGLDKIFNLSCDNGIYFYSTIIFWPLTEIDSYVDDVGCQ